jgi:hypothetical protein
LAGAGEVTSGIIYGAGSALGDQAAMGIGTVGGRLFGGAATAIMSGYNLAGDIEPDDTSAEVADAAGVTGGGQNRRDRCSRRTAHAAVFRRRRPQTVRNLSPPLVMGMTVSTAVWGTLAS